MGQSALCREPGVAVATLPDTQKESRRMNIMLLGDTCVGKSSLVQRFFNKAFQVNPVTICLQSQSREVEVNGEWVKVQVFDTPGLERFQAATLRYFPLAACIAVTYSITDRSSFDSVRSWAQTIEAHGNRQAFHMLVANKADLEEERVVSADEGRALARSLGLNFFETSAKTAQNVDAAFASMATTSQLRVLELEDAERKRHKTKASVRIACCRPYPPAAGMSARQWALS